MKAFNILTVLALTLLLGACAALQTTQTVQEEITYAADGQALKGYLAYDKSIEGKRPGILVVHEWWGHNDYARKRADMLASLGYTAFALDMYGDGKQAKHPKEAGELSGEIGNNKALGEKRFLAALALLRAHPTVNGEKIAAIGYCFGGGVVLHMARVGTDIGGVVSFHGSLQTDSPAQTGGVKTKVLVLHGADDQFISAEQVAAFKAEMEAAQVDYEFIAYPGAAHSFTNPAADAFGKEFKLPLKYDEQADRLSWAKMQSFFKTIF